MVSLCWAELTLNGQQIYSEAIQEVEKIEDEIRKSFEMSQPSNDRIMYDRESLFPGR
jgi:hypothetical protein